jgi:signal transduction histidine kinase
VKLRRPSIRALLLGANTAVVVLPLLAFMGLRIYDIHLLRQTERQLIAESVLIGEAYREALARELGTPLTAHRPPAAAQDSYIPIEPQIDIGLRVLPAQPTSLPLDTQPDASARRAGSAIEPLLLRAQTFNLSAIRVLDTRGCVVATTRSEAGMCLGQLPEVRNALLGHYTAVARERISDEPPAPFGDVRRRGTERVFAALPVFADGRVIAVVRASRTGLDAFSTLWWNRRGFVIAFALLALLTALLSFTFSAAIAAPLRRLTRAARGIADGSAAAADSSKLTTPEFAPAEVAVLADVLQTMTERLTARARYVTEFASNASHELKSPITAIRGAAELLSQHDDMPIAQRARFVQNIADDAARMERLVTRMLELARIESEAREPAEQLDVFTVASAILERYQPQVLTELDQPPRTISMPEPHLRTLLVNLVENAMRHGAGQPVHVRLSGDTARLRIDVCDRGPGISEANQARLFQRFFTTERDRGGTGLGLSIVKAIAEAHGGEVSAHSGPDGSTFSVLLATRLPPEAASTKSGPTGR